MSPPATVQQDGKLYTMLQDTLRSSVLDGPGIYDRVKVVKMLDAIAGMDVLGRNRADSVLMWMGSICLLHERLVVGTGD
jgi:asparagine synthase (glutamine-hydrolysing)